MNSVLAEILETGTTSGTRVHSSVSQSEGQFLQRLVREADPAVSLEIGLAMGISALFICEALNPRSRHICIDPNQIHPFPGLLGTWDGIGMANLKRAGYGDMVRLIEDASYRALPQLEASGQRIDFAFIDGWHTFDFAFVDMFYIDRMLRVGGVVVFDDADYPAIRKVCRFVATNLAYTVLGGDWEPKVSLKRRAAESLLGHRGLSKIVRSDIIIPDSSLGLQSGCIAFRKEADDSRSWDHFADF